MKGIKQYVVWLTGFVIFIGVAYLLYTGKA